MIDKKEIRKIVRKELKAMLKKELKQESPVNKKEVKSEKFTDREKMFLHKKNLKTKADSVVDNKTE